jgi:hypothetical protein
MMRLPVVIICSALFLHGRKPSGWSSLFAIFFLFYKILENIRYGLRSPVDVVIKFSGFIHSMKARNPLMQSHSFVPWDGILGHRWKNWWTSIFLTSWLTSMYLNNVWKSTFTHLVKTTAHAQWSRLTKYSRALWKGGSAAILAVQMFKNSSNGNCEPKRLLFIWSTTFSAYIQSLRISKADSLNIGQKLFEKSHFWKVGFSPMFLNNVWKVESTTDAQLNLKQNLHDITVRAQESIPRFLKNVYKFGLWFIPSRRITLQDGSIWGQNCVDLWIWDVPKCLGNTVPKIRFMYSQKW